MIKGVKGEVITITLAVTAFVCMVGWACSLIVMNEDRAEKVAECQQQEEVDNENSDN